tara:strand:+ start:62 stop:442 length:381 start_codon:yes stop_codon:yes gene_type:complete
MNLAKKYKQLFEGKTRSNDTNLLSEVGDPILAKLLQKSAKASVKDGEDELYNLSQEWEEWNVDNDDKYDELRAPLDMAVELVQDAGEGYPDADAAEKSERNTLLKDADKILKQFNKDVVKVMRLER